MLIRFQFFDELKHLIIKELKTKKYDIVIHSAAVSDYRPAQTYSGKVKSSLKNWRLNLVPTTKIIDAIKRADRSLCLVGFKFEPYAPKTRLIRDSRILLNRKSCNLVVGNTVKDGRYVAYIIQRNRVFGPIFKKERLVKDLVGKL